MLVLSRKKGESIMIGDEIEVIVLSTDGDTIKLGVQAPRQVEVFRKEIYEAIQLSNQEASQHIVSASDLSKLFKK